MIMTQYALHYFPEREERENHLRARSHIPQEKLWLQIPERHEVLFLFFEASCMLLLFFVFVFVGGGWWRIESAQKEVLRMLYWYCTVL
jgi:hypothetical protein